MGRMKVLVRPPGLRLTGRASVAYSMPFTPKSKSGQLADQLRARIAAGEWADSLPPERHLADEYFVSRSTVRVALRALTSEGLIRLPGSTRSGRRLAEAGKAVMTVPAKSQVVFLTPSLRASPLVLEHLAALREWFGKIGVQVQVREAHRLLEGPNPAGYLRRWAGEAPNAVWILHTMPPKVQRIVESIGLRAVVFGSVFPGISLPHVDVDFLAVGRHAAGRCLARGHRRLAVLVHRTELAGNAAVIDGVTEELRLSGAPPPLVLRHDFHRNRLTETLDREVVASGKRPAALIIVNQHHLLTALPHLLHRGLRIPHDISLVYLSNDPVVERLSPLPDRYDLGNRLVRRLAKAVQARLAGEIPVSASLLPRMLKGETLA